MNVMRNIITLKKLTSNTYLCKSLFYVKNYSKTIVSNNKNSKNVCDCTSNKNKVQTSKHKNQSNVIKSKIIDKCEFWCSTLNSSESKNNQPGYKEKEAVSVAIVGGGCTTICTATLLKQNPAIKEIHLIDTDNSLAGPVCDLRQIDTSTIIKHYKKTSLLDGLRNTDIVALMDETDFKMGNKGPFSQFISSASYVKNIAECMINICPNALIAVFTRPVTATLPLVSEIYKYSGNWNQNKVIGSAALESMRIAAMTAEYLDLNPLFLSVPVVGGIDSLTIVPLLSRARPFNNFTIEEQCMLIHELKTADKCLFETEIKGPTLSSGVAAAKFISTLINGMKGQSTSVASAYIKSDILPSCQYMTSELKFGPNGVQKNFGMPKMSPQEIYLLEQAIPIINKIVDTVTYFIDTFTTYKDI